MIFFLFFKKFRIFRNLFFILKVPCLPCISYGQPKVTQDQDSQTIVFTFPFFFRYTFELFEQNFRGCFKKLYLFLWRKQEVGFINFIFLPVIDLCQEVGSRWTIHNNWLFLSKLFLFFLHLNFVLCLIFYQKQFIRMKLLFYLFNKRWCQVLKDESKKMKNYFIFGSKTWSQANDWMTLVDFNATWKMTFHYSSTWNRLMLA